MERDTASLRLQIALSISTFLAALNFFAISPFLPEIAADLGTSVPLIGQVATLMILISAVVGLVVGPVSDRIGQRAPLVLGIVAVAINLIGISLVHRYGLMLGLAIAGGFADALVFNLPFAVIGARMSGTAQRRALSATFASLSAAPILGVPVLTAISSLSSWRVALGMAGFLSLIAAVLVWRWIPADIVPDQPSISLREIGSAYLPLLHEPDLMRMFVSTLFRAMCSLGALAYIGALLDERFGLTTIVVGLMFTAGGIGNVLGSLAGGRIMRIPLYLVVVLATIGTGIATIGIFGSHVLVLSVGAIVLGSFCSSLANVGIGSLLMQHSTAGIGTTMVLNGTMLNFGAAFGVALAGLVLHGFGYSGLAIALPICAIVAVALLIGGNQSADAGRMLRTSDS